MKTNNKKGGEEIMEEEVYCYACGRATDHRGEHDSEKLLGIVKYTENGVELTDLGYKLKQDTDTWNMLYELVYRIYDAQWELDKGR